MSEYTYCICMSIYVSKQECESEWSDNKKLIKLKNNKIAQNIPKGNNNNSKHAREDEKMGSLMHFLVQYN